jgi:phytoene synthase
METGKRSRPLRGGGVLHPPKPALARCQAITRSHSQTFYFASSFFPAGRRQAVWAVYAACRLGDDIADSPARSGREQLDSWWEQVQAAFAGQPSPDPTFSALRWAVHRFPVPQAAFEELYLGLRMDLDGWCYRNQEDLELYCHRVAGVVGWMIAPICGYRGGQQTCERAVRLGMAMQLTNILRDVGEDLRLGRVYLPEDLLARHGLSRDALAQSGDSPAWRALTSELIALARQWYREGNRGIRDLSPSAALPVALAARAYEGILGAIERNGYDNLSRRARVPMARKLALVPKTCLDLVSGVQL